MLPAHGYTLPANATECLNDPAVDAVDFRIAEAGQAVPLAETLSKHPFGVVNIHLGAISLGADLNAWCDAHQPARSLAATGWGTTVSIGLSARSPELNDEAGIARVVDVVRSIQRRFEGSRLYVDLIPAVKEPSTPQRDADLLSELLHRTGCGWLLNLADVFSRSRNVGFDPYDQIAEVLPSATSILSRVSSVRFEKRIGAVVTAAEGAIPDEIWSLLRHSLVLGSHKMRAVFIAGREVKGGEALRKNDLRHARFINDRVQARLRMMRQQPSSNDSTARGTIRGA